MQYISNQHKTLPPIYRDLKRLLVMIEQAVLGFSRGHRYSIGADLRQQGMKALRLVHRALREKSQQAKHVKSLVWALDDLRLSLQLAKELHAFRSFAVFEQLAQLCQQVGKQSGGWLKALHNTQVNNP